MHLAVDFMRTINLSEENIKYYQTMLDGQADQLTAITQTNIPSDAFGGSPMGRELGQHTAKAQQKVTEAIAAIVATLTGYSENITKHVNDTTSVDEGEASIYASFARATDCVPTTLRNPSQAPACTAPPTEGD